MKKFSAALAIVAAFGVTAPAFAAEVRAQDPASVVSALQKGGYKAQLTTDSSGDPFIHSATNGSDFEIFFYGCTDNRDCRTIQFHSGYQDPAMTLQSMNSWNAEHRFGRAYLDSKGVARIEMDIDLDDGGISQELFEDNVEFWTSVMADFEEQVWGS
ncbi:MAG: YbjN domain-containing protein [Porphyrobacter sp.]|nr:YbjN domain-containing protein [Porphyrobacter sp.]